MNNVNCWCCGEDCVPVKVSNKKALVVCGSCYGDLVLVDQRLLMIEKHGRLPEYLTADGADVPQCEKGFIRIR